MKKKRGVGGKGHSVLSYCLEVLLWLCNENFRSAEVARVLYIPAHMGVNNNIVLVYHLVAEHCCTRGMARTKPILDDGLLSLLVLEAWGGLFVTCMYVSIAQL